MTKKATDCLEKLLQLNSNNKAYYKQILEVEGIDVEKPSAGNDQKIVDILSKYEELLPKSNAHQRLAVDLLSAGPLFKQKVTQYMRPQIIKGIPSLINDFKSMYRNHPEKAVILGEVLQEMNDNMEKDMVLHPDDEEEQDPTVQFWLYYFISQHHFRMYDIDKAFEWVAKAIEHTPTVLELYIHKAKIM